jgi:hypothetical protein
MVLGAALYGFFFPEMELGVGGLKTFCSLHLGILIPCLFKICSLTLKMHFLFFFMQVVPWLPFGWL